MNRISIGLAPPEARALAECLRNSMIGNHEPEGLDPFAHGALHDLETVPASLRDPASERS